jgi:hypothetical protein
MELNSHSNSQNYIDLFDALAMQLPEDLVIQEVRECGTNDKSLAIHLCHANGWSAADNIGQSFNWIHQHVPRINNIIPHPQKMLEAIMKSQNGYERLGANSIRSCIQLDRHPRILDEDKNPPFNLDKENFYLRFERQCVCPITSNQFLFTIRTYITQVSQLMLDNSFFERFISSRKFMQENSRLQNFLDKNSEIWEKYFQKKFKESEAKRFPVDTQY